MIEISCRCGAAKKRFKYDIGEFFINDCCSEAGFNHLGQRQGQTSESSSEPEAVKQPVVKQKYGKGKLKDMRVEQLKLIAAESLIANFESMTKKQLIEAILTS